LFIDFPLPFRIDLSNRKIFFLFCFLFFEMLSNQWLKRGAAAVAVGRRTKLTARQRGEAPKKVNSQSWATRVREMLRPSALLADLDGFKFDRNVRYSADLRSMDNDEWHEYGGHKQQRIFMRFHGIVPDVLERAFLPRVNLVVLYGRCGPWDLVYRGNFLSPMDLQRKPIVRFQPLLSETYKRALEDESGTVAPILRRLFMVPEVAVSERVQGADDKDALEREKAHAQAVAQVEEEIGAEVLERQRGEAEAEAREEAEEHAATVADGSTGNFLDSHYTLLMVGPDEPSREYPTERGRVFWAVANISAESASVDDGDTLVDYEPPMPLRNAGEHRYVFLLVAQKNGAIDVDALNDAFDGPFSTRTFIERHNLKPRGLSFFQSEYHPELANVYKQQGVEEPFLETEADARRRVRHRMRRARVASSQRYREPEQ
jgi:phosphatidylethanolamine-binding protein (PEBP) family uncharacterized protein